MPPSCNLKHIKIYSNNNNNNNTLLSLASRFFFVISYYIKLYTWQKLKMNVNIIATKVGARAISQIILITKRFRNRLGRACVDS